MFRLELVGNTENIGSADDLAIILSADREKDLMAQVNLRENEVQLVSEKTEAVILRGMRRRDHVTFLVKNVDEGPGKHLKYMGVVFGANGTFGCHVTSAAKVAEAKTEKLPCLMPNIGDASSRSRRLLLFRVVQYVMFYDAPVWCGTLQYAMYRK